MVANSYPREEYNSLKAGTKGRFKMVHRIDLNTAVCLISRLTNDNKDCRKILKTKYSNSNTIKEHAKKQHGFDIDEYLSSSNSQDVSIQKFTTTKELNDIWTYESAISKMVAVDFFTLHQIKKSETFQRMLSIVFNKKRCNSFREIRRIIVSHGEQVRLILKNEIMKKLRNKESVTVSFDEWTSPSNIQMINLIANFSDIEFNLGVVQIMTEKADSVSIQNAIFSHLDKFGISKEYVFFLIGDGAAVNTRLSKLCSIPIQQCQNHGIQLAIMDTFYKKCPESEEITFDELDISESHPESGHSSDYDDIESCNESSEEMSEDSDNQQYDLDSFREHIVGVPESLEENVMPLIAKIRNISKKFKSPKNQRFLKKYTHLKTILDVKTRWSSLYTMNRRFLDILEPLKKASIDAKFDFEITKEEIKTLKDLNNVLETSSNLVQILSNTQANLNTSDLAVSKAVEDLDAQNSTLSKKFKTNLINRFNQKKTFNV